MDEHQRPDPDALLASIQKQDEKRQRAKLKIFFGMAAGVGKTYAMLEAAHRRRKEGVDVVIGYIETHQRAETKALAQGLELIPRQKLEYRGVTLEEMDIDAILQRKPQLVLVDELAHTNAHGARHNKRYQDIQELLEAGIDVYTTVNVQHFESRADTVRQITGVTVQETVPDSVLDLADSIELIDISPEDLRQRLAEGKVYTAERATTARDHFFRVGNLTALREMALRLTAERVDHQLQDYMQLKSIAGPWKSGERLLVAVSPSPFSEQLIRWTRRMAYNLEASWLAAYVETPTAPTGEASERLTRNLALVRELGGEIVVTAGSDVSQALLHIARQRNVTQIVVGKPLGGTWLSKLRGSLVDQLIGNSGEIDIYVVTGDTAQPKAAINWQTLVQTNSTWQQYALALGIISGTVVGMLPLLPLLGYQSIGLLQLVVIVLLAVYIGRGPATAAAAVGALMWDFLFIEPRMTFSITHTEDAILFALYFVIALLIGNLTARLRTQERQAKQNADRSMALYTLAREIATAKTGDQVLAAGVAQIGQAFGARVAVVMPDEHGGTQLHGISTLPLSEKEMSVARWAYEHGKPSGKFTDTLPLAEAHYQPLTTLDGTLGVIGIQTPTGERLSYDQQAMLETFVKQIALALERELPQ
jgi:two-component system, OmpR family, sensor histidine kinase KdpD